MYVFTQEINKIALRLNDDKRIQSIESMQTYAQGTSKDLIRKKEEIKCNNKKQRKIFNFDYITKEDIK